MSPQLPRETPRRFEPARPLLIEGRSVSRTRSPFFTPVHRVSRWDGFRSARHAAFATRQRCEGNQLLLPCTSIRAPVPRVFPNLWLGGPGRFTTPRPLRRARGLSTVGVFFPSSALRDRASDTSETNDLRHPPRPRWRRPVVKPNDVCVIRSVFRRRGPFIRRAFIDHRSAT